MCTLRKEDSYQLGRTQKKLEEHIEILIKVKVFCKVSLRDNGSKYPCVSGADCTHLN